MHSERDCHCECVPVEMILARPLVSATPVICRLTVVMKMTVCYWIMFLVAICISYTQYSNVWWPSTYTLHTQNFEED